jgi:hypothetical protein
VESEQKETNENTFKKLKVWEQNVVLDMLPRLQKMFSKTAQYIPPQSPHRVAVLNLLLGDAWRSTLSERAKFFGVAPSTITKVENLVFEDTQLACQKYPEGVERERSNPEREEYARFIIDDMVQLQSGRDWKLCPFNDHQLFRLYKEKVQVLLSTFVDSYFINR